MIDEETAARLRNGKLAHYLRAGIPPEDAEDLVQEVFVRFLCRIQNGDVEHPKGFFHGIARLTMVEYWRRKGDREAALHWAEDLSAARSNFQDLRGVEVRAYAQQCLHAIHRGDDKKIVYLRAHGFKWKEIGAEMGFHPKSTQNAYLKVVRRFCA